MPATWRNELILASALLVACGGAPPVRSTPTLHADLAELAYFVGDWRAEAEDPTTGKRFELRYRVEPALAGAWLSGRGHSAELAVHIHDLWGRDPVSRELVRVVFDSNGVLGTVRSPGWRGDTLVFEGEARSRQGAIVVRETITRVGPRAFDAVWEARLDDAWTAYSIERLTRVD